MYLYGASPVYFCGVEPDITFFSVGNGPCPGSEAISFFLPPICIKPLPESRHREPQPALVSFYKGCEAISSNKNFCERKYINRSAEFRQDDRRLVGNKMQLPRKYREIG